MLKKKIPWFLILVKLYLSKCALGYEGLNPGLLRCAKASCHATIDYSSSTITSNVPTDDLALIRSMFKGTVQREFCRIFPYWSSSVVLCLLERNFSNIRMDTVNHDASIRGWGKNVHVVFILSLRKPAVQRGILFLSSMFRSWFKQ
jgi:hypothetical protein